MNRKNVASLAAVALLALGLMAQPGVAQAADSSATCGTLAPKTSVQTDAEYALAKKALASFCSSSTKSSTDASGGTASINSTGYGTYTRTKTTASIQDCTCGGGRYKTWTADGNASGVPYDGRNLNDLVLLWRTSTTASWNSATAPVTTYGSVPYKSGTMSATSTVYSVATLFNSAGRQLDQAKSQAS